MDSSFSWQQPKSPTSSEIIEVLPSPATYRPLYEQIDVLNARLVAEPQLMRSAVPGLSRREAISRGMRYGAAAAAGSLIVSATAATPAMASSGEKPKECEVKFGEINRAASATTAPVSPARR
jgi:hypothetical protein